MQPINPYPHPSKGRGSGLWEEGLFWVSYLSKERYSGLGYHQRRGGGGSAMDKIVKDGMRERRNKRAKGEKKAEGGGRI
jgi:hypothetical protein